MVAGCALAEPSGGLDLAEEGDTRSDEDLVADDLTSDRPFDPDGGLNDPSPDGVEDDPGTPADAADTDHAVDPEQDVDLDADSDGDDEPWTLRGSGTWADPYLIDRFPFSDEGDTSLSSERWADTYACAPTINESGAEIVYRLEVPHEGILMAAVEVDSDDIDPDLHLLSSADPLACLVRSHKVLYDIVAPEEPRYLVVDTWVDSSGVELDGPYRLAVEFGHLPGGPCALQHGEIALYNREVPLPLPAIGEVVREAHLVTTAEFPDAWPTAPRDGIDAHYALSEATSGYVMSRREDWAPAGEGGCEYGQGSTVRPPVIDEAWYVNMYWRNRPAGGTRMLVFNPVNGLAVVTSAGYETGPGSATRIGGACEEIHHALSSTHGSRLLMGFLVDQELPLGPIACD